MPRLPRIRVEGAVYYVTSRAIQNEEIFKDKEDYKMYLELMNKYKGQHKFKLFSYCLLPDRLELLIEAGDDASISEIMHDLNSLYTKHFNSRHQKSGHVFESRFRSVLVEKVHFLLAMTRHVHRAPWRHEKTYSLSPKEYPYSSFHVYVYGDDKPTAADPNRLDLSEEVKEVLHFLKSKDDKASYESYVLEGEKKEIEFLEKSLRRGQVLGSDAFQQEVKKKVQEHTEELLKEGTAPKTNPVYLYIVGGLVILATASSVYLYVSKEKIQSKYETLLTQKETEFSEKVRFENRSPIALSDLDGTRWTIEKISLPAGQAQGTTKDTLYFTNGKFSSAEFLGRGFSPTDLSMKRQPNGLVVWETHQSNAAGDTVGWRGSWQGDVMKGVVSFTPAGEKSQNFSFFSTGWAYVSENSTAADAGGAS